MVGDPPAKLQARSVSCLFPAPGPDGCHGWSVCAPAASFSYHHHLLDLSLYWSLRKGHLAGWHPPPTPVASLREVLRPRSAYPLGRFAPTYKASGARFFWGGRVCEAFHGLFCYNRTPNVAHVSIYNPLRISPLPPN